mmetsp:Transcript_1346/g.3873  ORF Transcript_1346/g.3873 Transcript_1346/m.3873 type:complete len:228 (+) Transcript_1346:2-685(+)
MLMLPLLMLLPILPNPESRACRIHSERLSMHLSGLRAHTSRRKLALLGEATDRGHLAGRLHAARPQLPQPRHGVLCGAARGVDEEGRKNRARPPDAVGAVHRHRQALGLGGLQETATLTQLLGRGCCEVRHRHVQAPHARERLHRCLHVALRERGQHGLQRVLREGEDGVHALLLQLPEVACEPWRPAACELAIQHPAKVRQPPRWELRHGPGNRRPESPGQPEHCT